MTRLETLFVTDGDLIIVTPLVTGPRATATGRIVLGTGSAVTTMTHEMADLIGYSARDGFKRTRVHTAMARRPATLCAWPSSPVSISRC
jgi:hypothetical protein